MRPVVVIIPAYNEEGAIAKVIAEVPQGRVDQIIVVDNGSTDATAKVAEEAGALVVTELTRGYGNACLRGIEAARSFRPHTLVFLDGDHSDYPEQMERLLEGIRQGDDLVIGSRMRGTLQRGSMPFQARFGNWLAGTLMRWGWGAKFTDLGPFRAVRLAALERLQMADRTFGWTVEMQLKAVEAGLRCGEVPVDYRPRIGKSKISGTVWGTLQASVKILHILGHYWITKGSRHYPAERGGLGVDPFAAQAVSES